jgi:hypothetical protein
MSIGVLIIWKDGWLFGGSFDKPSQRGGYKFIVRSRIILDVSCSKRHGNYLVLKCFGFERTT